MLTCKAVHQMRIKSGSFFAKHALGHLIVNLVQAPERMSAITHQNLKNMVTVAIGNRTKNTLSAL